MKFDKTAVLIAVVVLVGRSPGFSVAPAQEEKKAAGLSFSYQSGGRRDPFKDLYGGRDVKRKKAIGGLSDLAIEEVVLMGIVNSKGKFEAILALTEGFPLTIREGDRLSDGFVLSVEENHVVFRKTRDSQGLPLAKPKNIVKEINPEER